MPTTIKTVRNNRTIVLLLSLEFNRTPILAPIHAPGTNANARNQSTFPKVICVIELKIDVGRIINIDVAVATWGGRKRIKSWSVPLKSHRQLLIFLTKNRQ